MPNKDHDNVCLDDSDKNKDYSMSANNYSIKLSDVRKQIEKDNNRSDEKDKMVSKENKDENFSVPQAKCISPGIMEEIGSDRERLTEDLTSTLTSSSRKDSSESNSRLTTNHNDILANCKINKP